MFKMARFAKIVSGLKLLTSIVKCSILDLSQGSENSYVLLIWLLRISRYSVKVFHIFGKFTGEHLCRNIKVADCWPPTWLKACSGKGFSCEFCKISPIALFYETLLDGCLLIKLRLPLNNHLSYFLNFGWKRGMKWLSVIDSKFLLKKIQFLI